LDSISAQKGGVFEEFVLTVGLSAENIRESKIAYYPGKNGKSLSIALTTR
jgi:hypothetical protein